MRAVTRSEYGEVMDVLEVRDVEAPLVSDDEVLVRVHAAAVNAGDVAMVRGSPYLIRLAYGFARPRQPLLGQDMAGTVERVGAGVTRFAPGDEVFGGGVGTFAELAVAPEKRLARKPTSIGFEQAAALPVAGLTALQGIRDAGCGEGQKVLINGASGGVGTFAVQIAKTLGAEVTAVCSTRNVEQARSLGADHVIDYSRDDFTNSGERYDIIFDNAGSRSLADTRRVLASRGILIPSAGLLDTKWLANVPRMLGAALSAVVSRTRVKLLAQAWNPDDLAVLGSLVEAGEVTPVLEQTSSLDDAVRAIAHVGEGHARGKVIITI